MKRGAYRRTNLLRNFRRDYLKKVPCQDDAQPFVPTDCLWQPLNSNVEAVEKSLPKNRSHNAQKTTTQNALYSTLRRLGVVKWDF